MWAFKKRLGLSRERDSHIRMFLFIPCLCIINHVVYYKKLSYAIVKSKKPCHLQVWSPR